MHERPAVVEHWTASRHGLVLEGRPRAIEEIAGILQLPCDAPVQVTPSMAALALWGPALEEYTRAFPSPRRDNPSPAPV